ncbi:MAG: hypothetical protein C5S41_05560, partial [Candidatus Methanomarinus sp.]
MFLFELIILFVSELLLDEDREMPSSLFEIVLFVSELLLDEDREMPSYLFEFMVLF